MTSIGRWLAPVLVALSLLTVAPRADVSLSDLGGVDELKMWFNKEKGHVRLILLLSPT